ncbi:MAG: hypothetical protein AB7U05_10845 [Mangrovibacterium sp.]
MKKIALLGVLLLLVCGVSAQRIKKEVIYLKNGSVVKGQLVQVDDEKVVVRSARNTWVFNQAEIDTVTSKWLRETDTSDGAKTWFFKTSVGVLPGGSDNTRESPFSFDASLNVRLFRNMYAGLGAGLDLLEESYLPAFVNLEYRFRDSRFTPFIAFQGGYLLPLDGEVNTHGGYYYYDIMPYSSYWPYYQSQTLDNEGGLMFNPSLGFISQVNDNLGFSLSFGYRYSQVTFTGDNSYELETNYNRLSIKLGIIFN